MCFRPAETGATAVVCPHCEKKVRPAQGQMPKNCPFCKGTLEGARPAVSASAPSAPEAPTIPAVPGAPGAPRVPGAPEAPKAPNVKWQDEHI